MLKTKSLSWVSAGIFLCVASQTPHAGILNPKISVKEMSSRRVPEPEIPSLKTVPVPGPAEEVLAQFVKNKKVAIQLGKALFWDTQVGSDSKVACATCHFQAGVDGRIKNQLNPGVLAGDTTFQVGGVNQALMANDFPFTRFSSPNSDRNDPKTFDSNDVFGSQGVFQRDFLSASAGAADECQTVADPIYHGLDQNHHFVNTRQIENRHTPSVINAVFNLRNFWEGRANNVFNGVDPFGLRNKDAFVWKLDNGVLKKVKVAIESSALASQASGPPVSSLEMGCRNRRFQDVARKLLGSKVLGTQTIDQNDSVLGMLGHERPLYADLIKEAFHPQWWSGGIVEKVAVPGSMDLTRSPVLRESRRESVSQMESNFSLFFGLAIQLYESTLISDDSPFDRFAEGHRNALSSQQKLGLEIFQTKGRCIECHGGAEFTNASHTLTVGEERLDDMEIEGERSIYDTGLNNTGLRPTTDDISNGGIDQFQFPFSETRMVQNGFAHLLGNGFDPAREVPANEIIRTSVDGAFKAPSLRNVELTGPYFHNGGRTTLMQVVDFYNRGGDFFKENHFDMDEDVAPIGLTEKEKKALVSFLLSLTDERVRFKKAPFDHPSLCFPHGHKVSSGQLQDDGRGNAVDIEECIKEVGARGVGKDQQLRPFLNLDPFSR